MNLKRLNNYLAILWTFSCYLLVGMLAITTKGMTHDPSFSGGSEKLWLFPMLITVCIVYLSFGFMVLTWLMILVKKDKYEYKALFGISTKKAILANILLFVIVGTFILAVR